MDIEDKFDDKSKAYKDLEKKYQALEKEYKDYKSTTTEEIKKLNKEHDDAMRKLVSRYEGVFDKPRLIVIG